jgi:drug/metabolite transporter (DMT)-like permease
MGAFAANSLFCRMGLRTGAIDAAGYTTVRLLSGAIALSLISTLAGRKGRSEAQGSWLSAGLLFLYAITFSYAYLRLSIASGALILFGAVQATMILAGLLSGERPRFIEWTGLALALAGLVYLVSPGLTAPSPLGSALMAVAGLAWGLYSLRGRRASDPLRATTTNFVRAAPMALAVSLLAFGSAHFTPRGVALAALSGGVASGCGYVVWYAALRGLTATRAATVQLSVPVLTAVAGVFFLSEAVSPRLLASSVMILGGIGLALAGRVRRR